MVYMSEDGEQRLYWNRTRRTRRRRELESESDNIEMRVSAICPMAYAVTVQPIGGDS